MFSTSTQSGGGALYASRGAVVSLVGGSVERGVSQSLGSCVLAAAGSIVSLARVRVAGCQCRDVHHSRGALYVVGQLYLLEGSSIEDSLSGRVGGLNVGSGGDAVVVDSSIVNCVAAQDARASPGAPVSPQAGGALVQPFGRLTLFNASLVNNSSPLFASAIAVEANGTLRGALVHIGLSCPRLFLVGGASRASELPVLSPPAIGSEAARLYLSGLRVKPSDSAACAEREEEGEEEEEEEEGEEGEEEEEEEEGEEGDEGEAEEDNDGDGDGGEEEDGYEDKEEDAERHPPPPPVEQPPLLPSAGIAPPRPPFPPDSDDDGDDDGDVDDDDGDGDDDDDYDDDDDENGRDALQRSSGNASLVIIDPSALPQGCAADTCGAGATCSFDTLVFEGASLRTPTCTCSPPNYLDPEDKAYRLSSSGSSCVAASQGVPSATLSAALVPYQIGCISGTCPTGLVRLADGECGCPAGTFSNDDGDDEDEEEDDDEDDDEVVCLQCPPRTTSLPGALGGVTACGVRGGCAAGFYRPDDVVASEFTCRDCPTGARCPAYSTVSTLLLRDGWWRLTPNTSQLLRCDDTTEQICLGGRRLALVPTQGASEGRSARSASTRAPTAMAVLGGACHVRAQPPT